MKMILLKDFKFKEDDNMIQKKKGDIFETDNPDAFILCRVAKKAPKKKAPKKDE